MSLFKERERSAKKIISLQNTIHKLEAQLKEASCEKDHCDSDHEEQLAAQAQQLALAAELAESQKAELKKLKSENTRLKNKLAKLTEKPEEG